MTPSVLLAALLVTACAPGKADRPAQESPGMETLSSQEVPVTLDRERTTLEIEMQASPPNPRGGGQRLGLYLEGVEASRPGAYFEVYAGLPPGAEPKPEGPYYLGTLSVFGPSAEAKVGYDITELARKLQADGRWDGNLTLTFVRRGFEAPRGGPPPEGPPVKFSRVRIVRESPPP